MSRSAIKIQDCKTKKLVDAVLISGVTIREAQLAQMHWSRALDQYLKTLPKDDYPEHGGWDWEAKHRRYGRLAAYRFYGIECEGKMQGLLELAKEGHLAKLPEQKGRPLIYVKYIEVAAWNIKVLAPNPRFGGVGARLMKAAVELSLSEDCKGRLGLHSLPGANKGDPEWFYQHVCKMEPMESERDGEGLLYFELTAQRAQEFLKGGTQ